MINDRLFKKFNSIFWGILSWLPLFSVLFFALTYSLSLDITAFDNVYNFETFVGSILQFTNSHFYDLFNLESFFTNATLYFIGLFTDISNGIPEFAWFIILCVNWFIFIQLARLLVYVVMWVINFIYGLFDYLSFNRKGDN